MGVAIGLAVLGGALAAFFLSLLRLHRQMVDVKAREIDTARDLYAEAYEPLQKERTLDALERQHSLLGAAEALEKRARAIHEWPIDGTTVKGVVAIVTSVITMIVVRLIFLPFGL